MFFDYLNLLLVFFYVDMQDVLLGGSFVLVIVDVFVVVGDMLWVGYVMKFIFLCEGVGVIIYENGVVVVEIGDVSYFYYLMIVQVLVVLFDFQGFYLVIGVWIVGEICVGIGLCEDCVCIIYNLLCFKLYFIEG